MTEDWAEIRRLHLSERMSIKAIVRKTGLARNTVRAALASDAPPRYERGAVGSLVDGYEPRPPDRAIPDRTNQDHLRPTNPLEGGQLSIGKRGSVFNRR